MPDPDFYRQCLQDSFDALREATLGGQPAGTKRSRKQPARKRAGPAKARAGKRTPARAKPAAKATAGRKAPATKRKAG